jgi:Xaa-Pro aminopeptidase
MPSTSASFFRAVRKLRAPLLLAAAFAAELPAQIPAAEFAARRDALATTVGDGVVLVLNTLEPVPDYLPWRLSRPFFYLTGFREPNAALVMIQRGNTREAMLFVPPRDPAQEVWTGPRLGVENVQRSLGMRGRDVGQLYAVIDSLLATNVPLFVIGDLESGPLAVSPHAQIVNSLRAKHPTRRITDATAAVLALRGSKSEAEFDRLRIAAEISARGHLAAMRVIAPGVGEWEIQAAAEYVWRREGADGPGYTSIVGSGPNTTVLHYNASTRVAQAGELVVMDMAAEFDGYSADITRTVPVSGRFTEAQRAIYSLVLDAQLAAERQVRVGAPARAMTDSSNAVLRNGLARLGLTEGPDATYDCSVGARPRQCSQLSLYYMHGLGHGIGLDVHDPDQYYETGIIAVGSAFTIEPGVYVRAQLAEILPDTPRNRALLARIKPALDRFGGIGVRIEDDYLVTARGVERVSAGVPREIAEIERLMAEPRTPRDPSVTERFLRHRTGH